jgi:predicted RNA-binding protein with PIN domain
MWLAIDGYNLIAALTGEALEYLDLEAERENLLGLLADYRALSRHRLSLVFDGGARASGGSRRERIRGVEVIFSPLGRTADQLLVEMAARYGSGLTVVTSDREVAAACERSGAVTLASAEFWQRLLLAVMGEDEADDEEAGRGGPASGRHLTRKKGNPKKRGRKERRRSRRLDSL